MMEVTASDPPALTRLKKAAAPPGWLSKTGWAPTTMRGLGGPGEINHKEAVRNGPAAPTYGEMICLKASVSWVAAEASNAAVRGLWILETAAPNAEAAWRTWRSSNLWSLLVLALAAAQVSTAVTAAPR